jgi:hypothetical protein
VSRLHSRFENHTHTESYRHRTKWQSPFHVKEWRGLARRRPTPHMDCGAQYIRGRSPARCCSRNQKFLRSADFDPAGHTKIDNAIRITILIPPPILQKRPSEFVENSPLVAGDSQKCLSTSFIVALTFKAVFFSKSAKWRKWFVFYRRFSRNNGAGFYGRGNQKPNCRVQFKNS